MTRLIKLSEELNNFIQMKRSNWRPYPTFICPNCRHSNCCIKYQAREIVHCSPCDISWRFVDMKLTAAELRGILEES